MLEMTSEKRVNEEGWIDNNEKKRERGEIKKAQALW